MKKNLIGGSMILAGIALLFIGCHATTSKANDGLPDWQQGYHYPIIKVRDCEYIVVESGINYYGNEVHGLIHASDCHNPIHHNSYSLNNNSFHGNTSIGNNNR